jgi:hypothetical protein
MNTIEAITSKLQEKSSPQPLTESSVQAKDAKRLITTYATNWFKESITSEISVPKIAMEEIVSWTIERFDMVSLDFPVDLSDLQEQTRYACVDVIFEGLEKIRKGQKGRRV